MNENTYNDSDIQVLEGLEAVRKRPGMYIGTTSVKGLHHLVWEIVDNAVDESLAGYCDDIEVIVDKGNVIEVRDDGRGIPTGTNSKTGLSTIETIFTVLHAGGKFGGHGYKVSGGLHGVGASVVNALSEWLEVRVYHEGNVYFQRFENGGHSTGPLKIIDTCSKDRTGTTVRFKADPEIFTETTVYDYNTLKTRLRELAFLNKGLRIILSDLRDIEHKEEFLYTGGIIEYVKMLNENKTSLNSQIIYVSGQEDNISIEVALQYNETYNSAVYSFTNNINTQEGGTHEDGFRLALTRVINNYAKENNLLKKDEDGFLGDDVREGLTAIISVKHPDPQYEGQTKTKLGNSEVTGIVSTIVGNNLKIYLEDYPKEADRIIEKMTLSKKAREAAKKARELVLRKSNIEVGSLPGKLADCSSKDPSESEIFIVEGNSAGGSAKMGRDRRKVSA